MAMAKFPKNEENTRYNFIFFEVNSSCRIKKTKDLSPKDARV